jgi:hypothetical protein
MGRTMSPINSTLPVVASELTILRLETDSDPEPELPDKTDDGGEAVSRTDDARTSPEELVNPASASESCDPP